MKKLLSEISLARFRPLGLRELLFSVVILYNDVGFWGR